MTSFVSTWETSNISFQNPFSSSGNQIRLPLEADGTYNFTVNWGDGSSDTITAYNQAEVTHTYAISGEYTLTIDGTLTGFRFANANDKLKLLDITQWGDLRLGNNQSYFMGCTNLVCTATDALDLTGTTDLTDAWYGCTKFNGTLGDCDFSSVTTMHGMLKNCKAFNKPLSSIDTSSVESMALTFSNCIAYNQSNNSLDVSSVKLMDYMFYGCTSLDQAYDDWDISSVESMDDMFYNVSLSTTNYSNLLKSWALQTVHSSIELNVDGSEYYTSAAASRTVLTDTYGWTITDGGESEDYEHTHTIPLESDVSDNVSLSSGLELSVTLTSYSSGDDITLSSTVYQSITLSSLVAQSITITSTISVD